MSYSFKAVTEDNTTGGKPRTRISTGIHDCVIEKVEVVTVNPKGGGDPWNKAVVTFKATKTYEGEDSVGLVTFYDILFPNSQEASDKLGKRLIHIFNKTGGKANIEKATTYINEMQLPNIEEIVKQLNKFVGKSVRLKLVADQAKKHPMIPLYFNGYAEAVDVNYKETTLKYDPSTEATVYIKEESKKPNNTENPKKNEDSDDLPF